MKFSSSSATMTQCRKQRSSVQCHEPFWPSLLVHNITFSAMKKRKDGNHDSCDGRNELTFGGKELIWPWLIQGHGQMRYLIGHIYHLILVTCRRLMLSPLTYLPTKFSQLLPNLHTFITSSPFNVLAVLALHPSLLLLGHLHYPL